MNAFGKVFGNLTECRLAPFANDLTQIPDVSRMRTLAVFLAGGNQVHRATFLEGVLEGIVGIAFVGINSTPNGRLRSPSWSPVSPGVRTISTGCPKAVTSKCSLSP